MRQRQESLQRLLDSTAEGLFGVDPEGRCTFINRAALRMLGYRDEAELLGREIYELIQRAARRGAAPAPGRRCSAPNRERRSCTSPTSVFWRRDGGVVPGRVLVAPGRAGGAVDGAVATFFDISERLNDAGRPAPGRAQDPPSSSTP